jgi:hypothetical protein
MSRAGIDIDPRVIDSELNDDDIRPFAETASRVVVPPMPALATSA